MEPRRLSREQQALVLEHQDLITNIAKYHTKWASPDRPTREDSIGAALLELCEAARSWDPDRGVPFRAYAIRLVKHQLQLQDQAATFPAHVPVKAHTLIREIRNALSTGAQTINEVAKVTGINASKVSELWAYRVPGGMPLDFTKEEASDASSIEEQTNLTMEQQAVRDAIGELTPIQQEVINCRFGFTTGEPMITIEISDYLGLFLDQVKDAEGEAMDHLRGILRPW